MTPVLQGGRAGSRSGSGKSHSRHSGHFWIQLQGTLWKWRERGTHSRGVWGLCEEVLERLMNASGMLQECRMRLFRGGLLSGGRCGLGGNHRIIIPSLLTFFSERTCIRHFHTHRHTFQWEGESLRDNLTPSCGARLPPTLTDGFIYFLQGFMFVSLTLLPAAACTQEVKCYKIKYRVGRIPLLQQHLSGTPNRV